MTIDRLHDVISSSDHLNLICYMSCRTGGRAGGQSDETDTDETGLVDQRGGATVQRACVRARVCVGFVYYERW